MRFQFRRGLFRGGAMVGAAAGLVVVSGGTYTSDSYANAAAGSYEWTAATYSGDTSNAPANRACGQEPVGLLSAPTLLSPADRSVFSNFSRTATYTGQAVPGATFYLYQRLNCQPGGFTNCQPYPGGDTISVGHQRDHDVHRRPARWMAGHCRHRQRHRGPTPRLGGSSPGPYK